jgi:adenosylmethionine-8-amino-7-oxononanoate aminotransferase
MVPPEGYLQEIREICDRNDVLMIADEVMTGFGRTGTNFGVDHWDVVPDIIAVAKGMSAGYTPMGGVIANDRIKNVFVGGSGKFVHGHTYGGNPLSSATALAVLEYIDKHNLVQASADRGEYLLEKLQVLMDNPIVGDVRGKGLMVGVELVKDKATREPFPRSMNLSERVTQETVKRGAIVYPGGGMAPGLQGDQFLIGPPLTITEEQVDELVEAIEGGLAAVAAEVT